MKQSFPAWYATEKRVKSITKLTVLDSKGFLNIDENGNLGFVGSKNMNLQIPKGSITGISIVRQTMNWVVYILLDVFLAIIMFPVLGLIPLIIVLVFASGFGLLIGLSTKWVLIEYSLNNTSEKAYFASSEMFGWGGIFGKTQTLFNALKA